MDAVVGTDRHPLDVVGNIHFAQRAGEGLLIFMWVIQRPHAQNRAVRPDDLKPVGIVVPAFIVMSNRNGETPYPITDLNSLGRHDISFTGTCCAKRYSGQRRTEQESENLFVHVVWPKREYRRVSFHTLRDRST